MKKTSNHDVCSLFKSSISRTHKVLAASVVLTTALLCGCSDSDPAEEGGLTPEPQVAKKEGVVTVGSNPNDPELMKRITFYGKNGARASRATADFPSVGTEPTIPSGCPEFNTPNDAQQSRDENKKKAYVLNGGEGQIELYGGEVYITGTVETHNINGSSGTIYVMEGAKLTLTSGFNNQNAVIVVFGEIETLGGLTIGANGQILVKNDFHIKGDLNVEGIVVVNEELTVDGKIQFNNGKGGVKGKCISVYAQGDRAVDMSGGGELAIRSHLLCNGLYMGNTAQVYLWPNAMADVTDAIGTEGSGTTAMTSNSCGFYYYSSEGKTENALLNTEKFHVEGSADDPGYVGGLFANELKIKYGELSNCQPAFTEKFLPSADDCRISSDIKNGGCNPGNGKSETGGGETEPEPEVKPITIIDGPEVTGTHSHNHLSATCIQAVGEKAYVSWHLNTEYKDNEENYGDISQHMGCAEMYEVTEQSAQITSWLMNQDFDFNHLLVDGNKAYFVGDTKAYGATLGVIDLVNGAFGEGTAKMPYYNLYKATAEASRGTSGNCMVLDGDNYRIASYKGFQSFSADALRKGTLEQTYELIQTNGSAKHIAVGGGYIATLNLDEKGVEASPATITVYNPWGSVIKTISLDGDQIITPIDGKNVIAIDGDDIYVALGQNGVAKYSITDGSMKHYNYNDGNKSDAKKPLANGLCVDSNSKYVYVAHGAAGLIVLDKSTMEKVTSWRRTYKTDDGKEKSYSANYVQKVGNLIYIAYGRDGLEVVKLVENN